MTIAMTSRLVEMLGTRVSVLDCASPLALSGATGSCHVVEKRWRATAVQDASATHTRLTLLTL